jgi:hypothetical protein
MLDFEVQRCTRRCARTERELQPGEEFYSALIADGADVVRQDYAADAWDGPPDEAIGWWKSRMAEANARKMNWAPNDVMLHYFQQLEQQAGQEDMRYVLTLLMVRRRILRLEEAETDETGREQLVVFCPRKEAEYRVPVVDPDAQRIDEIQDELAKMLFADAT